MSACGRARALRGQASAFMAANLGDEGLTPSDIAQACAVSVRTLQRAFQEYDQTIAGELRSLRLNRARLLLEDARDEGLSITEIAYRCGFASRSEERRVGKEWVSTGRSRWSR